METTLIPSGTVVVGVDGSPSCAAALDWAVGHAVRERRQLTLAHGYDPVRPDGRELLRAARARARELAPDLAVHEALRPADPQVVLQELASNAATLVVGSRGRGPVRSVLLGSLGLVLARRATCPVVVVRPGHPGLVRYGVLVGLDASERSRPVLEFGYRQASLRDLPLTILHSDILHGGSDADAGLDVAEAIAGLAEKFPEVRARTRLVADDPAEALARESQRMDLVVVGAHHGGALHASVTSAVIERAACPVAVVPLPVGGSES
ncbi:universal stress protein [Nocardioides hungaricus]